MLSSHGREIGTQDALKKESQVSMRVVRGNASLLSSHGRGIGIQPPPPTCVF